MSEFPSIAPSSSHIKCTFFTYCKACGSQSADDVNFKPAGLSINLASDPAWGIGESQQILAVNIYSTFGVEQTATA